LDKRDTVRRCLPVRKSRFKRSVRNEVRIHGVPLIVASGEAR
jgi:hypothetical protein